MRKVYAGLFSSLDRPAVLLAQLRDEVGAALTRFELVEAQPTSSGALIATTGRSGSRPRSDMGGSRPAPRWWQAVRPMGLVPSVADI